MSKLYVLGHTHEVYHDNNEPNRKFLQSKLIGVFDSKSQALMHFEKYKHITGFRESVLGLKITEYVLDSIYNDHVNALLNNLTSRSTLEDVVYGLYYVFDYPDGYEDIKLLGLFSSEDTSEQAKKILIRDLHFESVSNYINSFQHQINTPQWEEGFIKWAQTPKEKKQDR